MWHRLCLAFFCLTELCSLFGSIQTVVRLCCHSVFWVAVHCLSELIFFILSSVAGRSGSFHALPVAGRWAKANGAPVCVFERRSPLPTCKPEWDCRGFRALHLSFPKDLVTSLHTVSHSAFHKHLPQSHFSPHPLQIFCVVSLMTDARRYWASLQGP